MSTDEASKKSNETMIMRIAMAIPNGFYGLMTPVFRLAGELFERFAPQIEVNTWNKYCDSLADRKFCDQDTADLLKTIRNRPFPANVIGMLATMIKLPMETFRQAREIYTLDTQYANLAKTTPNPAPVDALVRSMIVDPGRASENRAKLKSHGYDDTQIDNIVLSHYRMVDDNVLRINFLRGNITETTLYERMRELGYTDVRTGEIIQTWQYLPGPQDLLFMVAKEAFEPDSVKLLGLGDEFPVDQVSFMKQQGISEFWSKKYWAAHWNQPSIGQGFEMFHRGVITYEELQLLFKTVEIPPFWRDKLTKIAYQPLARVDVRRMHDMGVIGPDRLVKAYTDIGYSPDDAVDMANFTIKFNTANNQEVTRGSVTSGYEDGLISRADALELLLSLDYDDDTADWYLNQADYNREKKLLDLQMDNVKEKFLLSISTETQTRSDLNAMGLRGEKITALLESWYLDQYKYSALPSKSDLDRFLLRGIISQDQYRQVMTRHGFAANHLQWFIEELQPEVDGTYRKPTKADLNNWYKKGTITEAEWRTEYSDMGYPVKYINNYFKSL